MDAAKGPSADEVTATPRRCSILRLEREARSTGQPVETTLSVGGDVKLDLRLAPVLEDFPVFGGCLRDIAEAFFSHAYIIDSAQVVKPRACLERSRDQLLKEFSAPCVLAGLETI